MANDQMPSYLRPVLAHLKGWLKAELEMRGIGTRFLDGASVRGDIPIASVPAHATTHANAGVDEISVVGLSGLLADGQTPVNHDHSGDVGDGGTFDAASLTSGAAPDNYALMTDGIGGAAWEAITIMTSIILGDASDPLTTGNDKNPIPLEAPCGLTIVEVRIKVKTAPTGANLIVDVNKGGVTIFTNQANRPEIAASAYEATTTTIDVAGLVKGDDMTFDIDQVGSTIAGSRVMVEIICSQVAA